MFCRPFQHAPLIGVILALASTATPVMASDAKAAVSAEQPYHVSHWTSEDGLPENRITALAQTRDGYLWVGTLSGLARFDGVRFTVFNEVNTPSMVSQSINALAVENDGTLWIGTANGLLSYRDGRFTRFTADDHLPAVWHLIASRAGGVWMQVGGSGRDKIVLWVGGRPALAADLQLAKNDNPRTFRENEDGTLSMATTASLKDIARDGSVRDQIVPSGTPPPTWGAALRQRQSQRFWVNTQECLWLFEQGLWQQVLRGVCRADLGNFIYEDRSGSVWVNRGVAGFWKCTGSHAEEVKLGTHGAEKTVGCMLDDRDGHLWVGSSHGLFHLQPTLIRSVTTENGLPSGECWSLCEAPDGAIWVETKAGAARIQNGVAQSLADDPPRDPQHSILADLSGSIWFGDGHYGLLVWRPGMTTNWFWSFGQKLTVEAFYLGRDGRVWIGTGQGVTWCEHGRPAAAWGEFGLPTNTIRSIYQTRDGTMWFGTRGSGAVRWKWREKPERGDPAVAGLALPNSASRSTKPASPPTRILRPSATRTFTTADGLADNRVFVFHEDAEGVLWIGTHNGLSRYKDGRFFTYRTEHGLLDNLINWLEEDDFDRFWFSCNRGIFRISRRELNAVADGQTRVANAAVYGTADGMPAAETNGEHQPAGCKDHKGRLWFPTIRGVVMIDPNDASRNEEAEVPPPAVIEQVMADEDVIYGDGLAGEKSRFAVRDGMLRLPPDYAGILRIRYTANSFINPRRVRFHYRLIGHGADWREVTDERVVYYTNLRPGNYRFEVKAANSHGVWNHRPAAFEFSLAPHFYETWSFYLLCGAGVALSGFGLHHRRVLFLRRIERLERDQALQAERARIARDLHDDLGANLTGIALKVDLAQRQIEEKQASHLADIAIRTRGLVDNMRETVWALNPKHDTLEGLARFLAQQAEDFVTGAGLRCRLELPDSFPAFTVASPVRYQIHLVIKEALHNAVKHAAAIQIHFGLEMSGNELCLHVSDDGQGFDLNAAPPPLDSPPSSNTGNGLVNMRQRVESLGGKWELKSAPNQGTRITIRIPTQSFRPTPSSKTNRPQP